MSSLQFGLLCTLCSRTWSLCECFSLSSLEEFQDGDPSNSGGEGGKGREERLKREQIKQSLRERYKQQLDEVKSIAASEKAEQMQAIMTFDTELGNLAERIELMVMQLDLVEQRIAWHNRNREREMIALPQPIQSTTASGATTVARDDDQEQEKEKETEKEQEEMDQLRIETAESPSSTSAVEISERGITISSSNQIEPSSSSSSSSGGGGGGRGKHRSTKASKPSPSSSATSSSPGLESVRYARVVGQNVPLLDALMQNTIVKIPRNTLVLLIVHSAKDRSWWVESCDTSDPKDPMSKHLGQPQKISGWISEFNLQILPNTNTEGIQARLDDFMANREALLAAREVVFEGKDFVPLTKSKKRQLLSEFRDYLDTVLVREFKNLDLDLGTEELLQLRADLRQNIEDKYAVHDALHEKKTELTLQLMENDELRMDESRELKDRLAKETALCEDSIQTSCERGDLQAVQQFVSKVSPNQLLFYCSFLFSFLFSFSVYILPFLPHFAVSSLAGTMRYHEGVSFEEEDFPEHPRQFDRSLSTPSRCERWLPGRRGLSSVPICRSWADGCRRDDEFGSGLCGRTCRSGRLYSVQGCGAAETASSPG